MLIDINTEIQNAFEVIKNGGIILYPTDTVWGIGCDATNPEAVSKVYKLKQRTENQSMIYKNVIFVNIIVYKKAVEKFHRLFLCKNLKLFLSSQVTFCI